MYILFCLLLPLPCVSFGSRHSLSVYVDAYVCVVCLWSRSRLPSHHALKRLSHLICPLQVYAKRSTIRVLFIRQFKHLREGSTDLNLNENLFRAAADSFTLDPQHPQSVRSLSQCFRRCGWVPQMYRHQTQLLMP